MNRKDIARMAEEADASPFPDMSVFGWGDVERLAAIIAAAEREACRKMFVAVIRARGDK